MQVQNRVVTKPPDTAVGIFIRAVVLSIILIVLTTICLAIVSYYSPHITSMSAHQFEDSNEAYARARLAAVADPGAVVKMVTFVLIILVWSVAGWQWVKLAQERGK